MFGYQEALEHLENLEEKESYLSSSMEKLPKIRPTEIYKSWNYQGKCPYQIGTNFKVGITSTLGPTFPILEKMGAVLIHPN